MIFDEVIFPLFMLIALPIFFLHMDFSSRYSPDPLVRWELGEPKEGTYHWDLIYGKNRFWKYVKMRWKTGKGWGYREMEVFNNE